MHILIGFLIVLVGSVLVIKSEAILNSFGRIGFFEKYLGVEGGSRLGYKLLGLTVIFIGTIIMTNMIYAFLAWLLSPLINAGKSQ